MSEKSENSSGKDDNLITLSKSELAVLKFFSLSNYRQIRTPFIFIDESGVLNDKRDPFFAIGSFKIHRPSILYPLFRSIRSRFNYKPELKFSHLSELSLPPAKAFLHAALGENGKGSFKGIIIPKTDPAFDIQKYFAGDLFNVYKKFLVILLKKNINEIEVATVIADDYFTPFSPNTLESFEGAVRALLNDHYKRIAVTGVCQVSSHSSDFIQLVDLILGSVMFDLKINKKLIDIHSLNRSQQTRLKLLTYLKSILHMDDSDSFFIREPDYNKRRFRSSKIDIQIFSPKVAISSLLQTSGPSTDEATPALLIDESET